MQKGETNLSIQVLHLAHLPVHAAECDQLSMRSLHHDLPVVEHVNHVGILNGGQTIRNSDFDPIALLYGRGK